MANWTEPKVDWVTNPKNPRAEDFNRIEGNIQFLKEDIENKKGIIIGALKDVGLSVDEVSTFAEIADAIINANQGKKIITPGTSNITIPKGFHNGQGYVKGDANLKSQNIIKGKSIFGIAGSAKPEQIAYGSAPVDIKHGDYKKAVVTGLAFTPRFVLGILSNNEHLNMIRSSTFPQFNWKDFYAQDDFFIGPDSTSFATKITNNGFEMFFYTQSGTVNWVAIG